MGRFETLLSLLAVVLASLAALQIPGRLIYALTAIMILTFVGSRRLRAALYGRKTKPTFSAYDRAQKIAEERRRRLDRE